MHEYILLGIYWSSILFSVIMAFAHRSYLKGRRIQIFLPFLLLVFLQEIGLVIFKETTRLTEAEDIYKPINFTYNFYKPLSVIVFAIVYYRVPFMEPFRKLILFLTCAYLIINSINFIFFEPLFVSNTYLTFARNLLITCFALFFLFRYFYLDNTGEEKFWQPLIWITIGVVIFYPVISIAVIFQKYLYTAEATVYGFKLYQLIPQVMSIFMYSCFSYAFYLCKKIN